MFNNSIFDRQDSICDSKFNNDYWYILCSVL